MELEGSKTAVAGAAFEGIDEKETEEPVVGAPLGPCPLTEVTDRASGREKGSEFIHHQLVLPSEKR